LCPARFFLCNGVSILTRKLFGFLSPFPPPQGYSTRISGYTSCFLLVFPSPRSPLLRDCLLGSPLAFPSSPFRLSWREEFLCIIVLRPTVTAPTLFPFPLVFVFIPFLVVSSRSPLPLHPCERYFYCCVCTDSDSFAPPFRPIYPTSAA